MGMRSLPRALWAERHAQWLTSLHRSRPVLTGQEYALGTVYRSEHGSPGVLGPLLVHCSDFPRSAGWFASVLAVRLGGTAVVPGVGSASGILAEASASARALGADEQKIVLIGEGDAVSAVLQAAADAREGNASPARLVLLHPNRLPSFDLAGLPPTFVQGSPASEVPSVSRALEMDLSEAGVAVRGVEYPQLPDGWARYPKWVSGADAVLDDIESFLRRIPGSRKDSESGSDHGEQRRSEGTGPRLHGYRDSRDRPPRPA